MAWFRGFKTNYAASQKRVIQVQPLIRLLLIILYRKLPASFTLPIYIIAFMEAMGSARLVNQHV